MKPFVRREVNIRPLQAGDREKLLEVYNRQKPTLGPNAPEFPDPKDPAQFVTVVLEDAKTGQVVGCGAARTVVEVALCIDPNWGTPKDRLRGAQDLIATGIAPIWQAGYKKIFAMIVGKHRWADRLVQKCGWYRMNDPVVGFDLSTVFGGKR